MKKLLFILACSTITAFAQNVGDVRMSIWDGSGPWNTGIWTGSNVVPFLDGTATPAVRSVSGTGAIVADGGSVENITVTGTLNAQVLEQSGIPISDTFAERGQLLYGVFTGDYSTGNIPQAAFSRDGMTWSSFSLNFSDTTPIANTSVAYRNGRYLMAAANVSGISQSNNSFLFKSSVDGINYTSLATVSCTAISGVNRVWAPEIFIDSNNDVYVFFCASTSGAGGPFQIYYVTPTNSELTSWSAPSIVTGTSLPSSWIDPCVVKSGADYYLFARDLTSDYIISYISSSPTSGYVAESTGNAFGFGTATYEAPSITTLDDGTWIMYLDHFASNLGIYYTTSTDLGVWTAPTAITSTPKLRHGTAFNTIDLDFNQLMVTSYAVAQSAFNFSVPANNLVTFEKSASLAGPIVYQFLNKNSTNGAYVGLYTGEGVSGLNKFGGLEYFNTNFSTSGLIVANQLHVFSANGATGGILLGTDANAPIVFATGGAGVSNERIRIDSAGLKFKSGSNAEAGTFTLSSGTATVSNTSITSNSVISITVKTVSGTQGNWLKVTPTASSGFSVTSESASDASVYNYIVMEVN